MATDTNDTNRSDDQPQAGILPLEVRRRLWEQIWNRLLAPPTPPEIPDQREDREAEVSEEAAHDAAA